MSDPTRINELDLVVGSLITTRPEEDRTTFEEEQDSVAQLQDQLREEGIDIDLLGQPGTEMWEGGIDTVGSLYQLSRLATRLERSEDIAPVLEDGPVIYDELDRAVTDIWDALAQTRFPHLVNSGINSYFLPIDFEEPITLPFENENGEPDEAYFGSSIQLQRELTDVNDLLQQASVSTQVAAYRCLTILREAAAQSIRTHLPIIVW